MELKEALTLRRSCRAFQPGMTIERETISELIRAAQEAPTWKNSQTGRYYIMTDPEVLNEVRTKGLPARNAANCANAPVLIVTAFVRGRSGFTKDGAAENELGDEWGAYDLGLQNENLLLKATELGLGTLVMGLRDGETLRQTLNIPDDQEVVSVIAVGYPVQDAKKPARKPSEDIAVWM